jgi:hypothetical protein
VASSLVVGSGIHQGQLTLESLAAIRNADRLLYMGRGWFWELVFWLMVLELSRVIGGH